MISSDLDQGKKLRDECRPYGSARLSSLILLFHHRSPYP